MIELAKLSYATFLIMYIVYNNTKILYRNWYQMLKKKLLWEK